MSWETFKIWELKSLNSTPERSKACLHCLLRGQESWSGLTEKIERSLHWVSLGLAAPCLLAGLLIVSAGSVSTLYKVGYLRVRACLKYLFRQAIG